MIRTTSKVWNLKLWPHGTFEQNLIDRTSKRHVNTLTPATQGRTLFGTPYILSAANGFLLGLAAVCWILPWPPGLTLNTECHLKQKLPVIHSLRWPVINFFTNFDPPSSDNSPEGHVKENLSVTELVCWLLLQLLLIFVLLAFTFLAGVYSYKVIRWFVRELIIHPEWLIVC